MKQKPRTNWGDILPASPGQTESEMKQDLFIGVSGIIAVGFVIWSLWGNSSPHPAPKAQLAHELSAELKRVSEQSPYMRTER
jgi:hypothetical protein